MEGQEQQEITGSSSSKGKNIRFNFAKGHPHIHELPAAELRNLLHRVSESELRSTLQYGPGAGHEDFLLELRAFLDRQCRFDDHDLEDDDDDDDDDDSMPSSFSLFQTEGVSHGVDLITTVATEPGDLVLTECPTYFLVGAIFHNHGCRVQALPMKASDHTIDVDRFQQLLEQNHLRPRMVYLIPASQNPTGHCLSVADRQRLAKLAYQYEFLIVADEVYHLLDWGYADTTTSRTISPVEPNASFPNSATQEQPRRPARMVIWNQHCHGRKVPPARSINDDSTCRKLSGCVSVSSFTKIFGPGVRCGWIEAEPHVVKRITSGSGYIQSAGCVAPVMGAILKVGLADRTIDQVLDTLRVQYQRRCQLLCDILQQQQEQNNDLDYRMQLVCRPRGGYFVWIQFPREMDSIGGFLDYCQDRGLNFMPGTRCRACGQISGDEEDDDSGIRLDSYGRLCFAMMEESDIRRGAELLIECFESYIVTKKL